MPPHTTKPSCGHTPQRQLASQAFSELSGYLPTLTERRVWALPLAIPPTRDGTTLPFTPC